MEKNRPLKFGRNRKWGATVALKLVGEWHDKSRCFGKIGVLKYTCCSVAQLCPTLCDPMDCSMPGFPVLHHLPELAQTHVHWVSDATQPSCPLLFPSPLAFSLSQHQGPSIQGCSWWGSIQYACLSGKEVDWARNGGGLWTSSALHFSLLPLSPAYSLILGSFIFWLFSKFVFSSSFSFLLRAFVLCL